MYYLSAFAALLLAAMSAYILWRVRPSLLTRTATALGRALLLVAFTGLYVGWLYAYDSVWLCLLWLVLMAAVAAVVGAHRVGLRLRLALWPLGCALSASTLVLSLYVLLLVLRPEGAMGARWLVPVAGLLLGSAQEVASVALGEYFKGLAEESQRYEYMLGNGATHREAVMPFVRRAMERAFAPVLRRLGVMGLAALPAAMLGMLMGGMAPMEAAFTLCALLVGGLATAAVASVLALYLADRRGFDPYGRLKRH